MAKELLRKVYAARDVAPARRRLVEFFQHCADTEVPELARLARTIDRCSAETRGYRRIGNASNGRVEKVHMLAEKSRRKSHNFFTHHNFRRRNLRRIGTK